VGIGPGGPADLTPRARETIAGAEVVVGYRTYLEQIVLLLEGKEVVWAGMREEVARAREAVSRARTGRRVAVVSGGDPGVYGMAGPVLEAAGEAGVLDLVTVVPGVTAATAAAALLGAPLMHDFAVISLSDLLTPWEVIAARLEAAAAADFVLVLYNPASSRRDWQLARAREILLRRRRPETPVGIVRHAGRPDEETVVTDLAGMLAYPVDMGTTVIVGNSQTYVAQGRMITPRGYRW